MTAKDLKNALLQEAVQGKLVPQIASEGNAKDLLEEIKKEKAKLIKEGKLKKDTTKAGASGRALPEITEEEIPFDIPENWCWCRLGEICTIKGGKRLPLGSSFSENVTNHVYIRVSDMKNNTISLDDLHYISDEVFEKIKNYIITTDDIYMTIVGATIGKCGIIPDCLNNMNLTENAARIIPFLVDKHYLLMCLTTDFCQTQFIEKTKQVGVQKMALTRFSNSILPLPPLNEQKRIVAAIEKFMPLIEEYGKKEAELTTLNADIAKTLKNAILQEAVQGKLAPQIASEGNAKDLLEEIKKEKAKTAGKASSASFASKTRSKELPPIEDDEIPFDIPENWCWCRLGEICNEIKRGKSPKYANRSSYLAFAQKCNVKTGGIDLGLALHLDESSIGRYSEADNLIQEDIVINSTGGGTMGRVGLYETKVPNGIKGVYPDSHVTVIRSIGGINQRYLYYVLKYNQPTLEKCGTGSTNQTELKPATLTDFVIPLPPVKEQKRIATTIEKLLPLCTKIGE